MGQHQILEEHEALSRSGGYGDESRQYLGHFDKGVRDFFVSLRERDGDLDRAGVEQRKILRPARRQRGQDRQDLEGKIFFQPALRRVVQFGDAPDEDAVLLQRRQKVVEQDLALAAHHRDDLAPGFYELAGGAVAGGVDGVVAAPGELTQSGDAHHEELVEVAAGDRDELQPFQQRIFTSLRLVEHSRIEIQPG